jgi:3',5'-cyclic AMP phosphodiesterase CpdA
MKIVLVSDTHLAPQATDFRKNCEAVRAWIETVPHDICVHLGDITAEGVKNPAHFAAARDAFGTWPSDLLFLPGNHDIGENDEGAGEHGAPRVEAAGLARYRQNFGPDHWKREIFGWTLLGLNAQVFGGDDEEEKTQFEWLEAALSRCEGPLGLMLHKPLFKNNMAEAIRHRRYIDFKARQKLSALLTGKDLRFVVSGHAHQSRCHYADGVEHFWAPSTAFIIPDTLQERIGDKTLGVATLTLQRDTHRFDLIVPPGLEQFNILDYADIYPEIAAGRLTQGRPS